MSVNPSIISEMKKKMSEAKTYKITPEFIVLTFTNNKAIPVQVINHYHTPGTFQLCKMNGVEVRGIQTEKSLEAFFSRCGHLKTKG